MRLILTTAAAALALAAAAPALAQSASGAASSHAATGQAASTAATAPASATLSVGQPVKDKTGVVIGSITDLKAGSGGQEATVKMGEQSFVIGAQSFVVQDGAAVINATQAELKQMIANAAKPG